jgi:hypothetical protein
VLYRGPNLQGRRGDKDHPAGRSKAHLLCRPPRQGWDQGHSGKCGRLAFSSCRAANKRFVRPLNLKRTVRPFSITLPAKGSEAADHEIRPAGHVPRRDHQYRSPTHATTKWAKQANRKMISPVPAASACLDMSLPLQHTTQPKTPTLKFPTNHPPPGGGISGKSSRRIASDQRSG